VYTYILINHDTSIGHLERNKKKKLQVEYTLYGYAKLYLKNRYIQVNDHNVECVRKMKGTLTDAS
jgi:hypothetical protein